MSFITILILLTTLVSALSTAWGRQWVMAAAMAMLFAYHLFDKVYPAVLPPAVVLSFAVAGFLLAAAQLTRVLLARSRQARPS